MKIALAYFTDTHAYNKLKEKKQLRYCVQMLSSDVEYLWFALRRIQFYYLLSYFFLCFLSLFLPFFLRYLLENLATLRLLKFKGSVNMLDACFYLLVFYLRVFVLNFFILFDSRACLSVVKLLNNITALYAEYMHLKLIYVGLLPQGKEMKTKEIVLLPKTS